MMTFERMNEIADMILAELDPIQAGDFAAVLKSKIENSTYNTEELEEIDAGLLSAGVDVNPICRKKHPTT